MTDKTKTENISVKPKKGRPRSKDLDDLAEFFPQATRRDLNNKHHMSRAQAAIMQFGSEKAKQYLLKDHYHKTLLADLGRLECPELIAQVAAVITVQGYNAKDGRAHLRKLRGQKRDEHSFWSAIYRVCHEYDRDLELTEIISGLEWCVHLLRKQQENEGGES